MTRFVQVRLPGGPITTVTAEYAEMLNLTPLEREATTPQGNPKPAKPRSRAARARKAPAAPAGEIPTTDQE